MTTPNGDGENSMFSLEGRRGCSAQRIPEEGLSNYSEGDIQPEARKTYAPRILNAGTSVVSRSSAKDSEASFSLSCNAEATKLNWSTNPPRI